MRSATPVIFHRKALLQGSEHDICFARCAENAQDAEQGLKSSYCAEDAQAGMA